MQNMHSLATDLRASLSAALASHIDRARPSVGTPRQGPAPGHLVLHREVYHLRALSQRRLKCLRVTQKK